MGKRFGKGDIIKIVMYSSYDNDQIFFEMEAPMRDKEKLRTLFKIARLKGLELPIPEEKESWW